MLACALKAIPRPCNFLCYGVCSRASRSKFWVYVSRQETDCRHSPVQWPVIHCSWPYRVIVNQVVLTDCDRGPHCATYVTAPTDNLLFRHICSEEKQCRFCKQLYPDWREAFPVDASTPEPSTITFALVCEDRTRLVEVKPGINAAEDLRRQVAALTGKDHDGIITCNVRLPGSGKRLAAADAAAHLSQLCTVTILKKSAWRVQMRVLTMNTG
jgi:hypothetical protein